MGYVRSLSSKQLLVSFYWFKTTDSMQMERVLRADDIQAAVQTEKLLVKKKKKIFKIQIK